MSTDEVAFERPPSKTLGQSATHRVRGNIGILQQLPERPATFRVAEANPESEIENVHDLPEQVTGQFVEEFHLLGVLDKAGPVSWENRVFQNSGTTHWWRLTKKGAYVIDQYRTDSSPMPCCDIPTTVKWTTVGDPQEDSKPYQCPECDTQHSRDAIEAALERERE